VQRHETVDAIQDRSELDGSEAEQHDPHAGRQAFVPDRLRRFQRTFVYERP
jgi:hypothetical protein